MPGQTMPGGDPPTPSCRVPPTLILRYLLHHKGLSTRAALESQTRAR